MCMCPSAANAWGSPCRAASYQGKWTGNEMGKKEQQVEPGNILLLVQDPAPRLVRHKNANVQAQLERPHRHFLRCADKIGSSLLLLQGLIAWICIQPHHTTPYHTIPHHTFHFSFLNSDQRTCHQIIVLAQQRSQQAVRSIRAQLHTKHAQ